MNSFFVGLQFLTRIHLRNQTEWTAEAFGGSVKYFPLIGMIIGALLVAIYEIASSYVTPFMMAVILVMAEFLITGGLHADGFMDTCDGIFSGRERERKLEIMKDSRVGSNGVVGFVFLVLFKIAVLENLAPHMIPMALFFMPTISRFGMVMSITLFPYARKEGMGKAFAQFAESYALKVATVFVLLPVFYWTYFYALCLAIGIITVLWSNRYIVKQIGGVTGDTYGAVTEFSELVLLTVLVIKQVLPW